MDVQRSFTDDGEETKHRRGKLYLVGTPIGNLEDITYRAVRTLKEADVIAAEDTRQTRKLLNHFGIGGTLVSYHEHNKRTSGPELVRRMLEGQSVALVSDAGLPGISDPGEDLVRLAIEAGIAVVPVPGPSASLAALIVSGLPSTPFRFTGFLPRGKKQLAETLKRLRQAEETLVIYESPHRLAVTLEAMRKAFGGNRRVAVVRELTKLHEEVLRGTLDEALAHLTGQPPRGEYVLVVEGGTGEPTGSSDNADAGADGEADAWWRSLDIAEHVRHYEERHGLPRKAAMKRAAEDRGLSRRDVYQALLED
jgi:16S rRNA (cytidine1402-2'-O)-methyltransferase